MLASALLTPSGLPRDAVQRTETEGPQGRDEFFTNVAMLFRVRFAVPPIRFDQDRILSVLAGSGQQRGRARMILRAVI